MSKSKTTVKMVTQWFLEAIAVSPLTALDINCSICNMPLRADQKIQWDHIHGEAMGGPHHWTNLRPVHYDPCHKAKSKKDVAALAKIDRITGITKGRPKRTWKPRPFTKSKRKMRSRSSFQSKRPASWSLK